MKTEQCTICKTDVVFESSKDSPREYDVCVKCEQHICPDCIGSYDNNNNSICKQCTKELA